MRGRSVHGGGLTGGLFGVGDPLGKARHLPLQPVDQLPLRRDGGVQVLNRLILMDGAHFKLVEAGGGVGCVCHGEGLALRVGEAMGESVGRVMTRQLIVRRGWQ